MTSQLPHPATRFFGRSREQQQILTWLFDRSRLVSIIGPGGVGKTRLALATLRSLVNQSETCWFIDLSHCETADQMCSRVAAQLHISLAPQKSAEQLIGFALEHRGPVILLLDNFEQLVPTSCQLLSAWLSTAEDLQILLTSRQATQLGAEKVLRLSPLETTGEAMSQNPAAQLFLDRAQLVQPNFVPDQEDSLAIADIANRLQGFPLALELAAARMAIFTPAQILQHLQQQFRLLKDGPVDLPQRQQSLWQTMMWSWKLLDNSEKLALGQATVFRGGFSAEAADAVMDLRSDQWTPEVLQRLVNKSLIYVPPQIDSKGRRFDMFHIIREFAQEQLDKKALLQTRQRHRSYFLNLGKKIWQVPQRYPQLELEQENLLAIVNNYNDSQGWTKGQRESAILALVYLGPLFIPRGLTDRIVNALDNIIRQAGTLDGEILAQGYALSAEVKRLLGDGDGCFQELKRAQQRTSQSELTVRLAVIRSGMQLMQGKLVASKNSLLAMQEKFGKGTSLLSEALATGELGRVHHVLNEFAEAESCYQRSLQQYRRLGDHTSQSRVLARLGFLQQDQGNISQAEQHYNDALQHAITAGDLGRQGITTLYLGNIARHRSLFQQGQELYRSSTILLAQGGDRHFQGVALMDWGIMMALAQSPTTAQSLLESSATILQEVGDNRCGSLVNAYLAALASLTAEQQAQKLLQTARVQHKNSGDPFIERVLDLLQGFLQLAQKPTPSTLEKMGSALRKKEGPVSEHVVLARRFLQLRLDQIQPPDDCFVLGRDGQWFQAQGKTVRLENRPTLQKMLYALCHHRIMQPNETMESQQLGTQVWPEEPLLQQNSLKNRVRVAIAELRKLGLRGTIVTRGQGYLLQPELKIILCQK